MEVFVSDDVYEYLTIGKIYIRSGVDDDIIVKSLEQHEVEIRKPLEDKIKELIKSKNEQENILLDKIIKLQKQLNQARQKVIAELEEWADENLTKLIKRGYFLPNNLRGLRLVEYEELKQKLNKMKGEK